MNELIYSFLASHFSDPEIFWITLAGITYPSPTYHIDRTHSAVTSIEYVQSGRGVLVVDGLQWQVEAGDTYLLPADADQHYWSDPQAPMQKIWVNVAGNLPRQLLMTYQLGGQIVYPGVDCSPILKRLLTLCADQQATRTRRDEQGTLLTHELFMLLHRYNRPSNQTFPLANKARAYLDNHLGEPLRIADLALQLNLSVSQLDRQFHQVFATSPYQYLIDARLTMAKHLLADTVLPINQIATRLAFSDAHYFSSFFLAKTGLRPSQWRQQQR